MNSIFTSIFKVKKPVVGMLHIDDLLGTPNYQGIDYLIQRAKADIRALQDGGIDGILIENWKEDSICEFVSTETAVSFTKVVCEIVKDITVPFGINVLNNDYKLALSLAKLVNASYIQLDVLVDHVKSNFTHSPIASKNPFEINVDPKDIQEYAAKINAQNIPVFCFVQPKHYLMLEEGKDIQLSVKQAIDAGVSAVLVTKETGTAPTIDLIKRAKEAAGEIAVGIGSGFSQENAKEYLSVSDFAVVGTSIKQNQDTDKPVDPQRVKGLMTVVKEIRRHS